MDDSNKSLSPYFRLPEPEPQEPLHGLADGEGGIDVRRYLRILYKRRWLILALLVCVVGYAAVDVYSTPPEYTAEATVQIEREAPKFAPVEGVQFMDSTEYDFYQTQHRVIRSRSIAARAIRSLSLGQDPRFVGGKPAEPSWLRSTLDDAVRTVKAMLSIEDSVDREPAMTPQPSAEAREEILENGVPRSLVDRYLGMLSVTPIPASRLVRIGFTTGDSELSAALANRHVDAYTEALLDQRRGMSGNAQVFLEGELAKTKDRLASAEAALNRFRKDKRIVGVEGEETDVSSASLVDLNNRLSEARGERVSLESAYQLVKGRRYDSIPAVADDLSYQSLQAELRKVQTERVELEQTFTEQYPPLRDVLAREGEIRAQIGQHVQSIVGVIEARYLGAKNREEMLQKELEAQRNTVLSQKDVSADYQTLKREVTTAQDLYSSLLQRLKEVGLADEARASNVWVVDPATVPSSPSAPNRRRSLTIALMIGLGLGVGLAFFLERLDDTVKTPEDVTGRVRLPTLGIVPSFAVARAGYGYGRSRKAPKPAASRGRNGAKLPARRGATELVATDEPRSVISEAYRSIRTAILMSSADRPPQVIVITSSSPSEGKTVTAVNQALTLAQDGGRVLLIDADVRKPRVHRVFGFTSGNGLTTYLTGQCELQAIIREPANVGPRPEDGPGQIWGGLHVITAGPMPPNPAELLGSRKMRETIALLREQYDYIVIDTPPVLPVTDAVLLSAMADGVVIVVKGSSTPIEVLQKCRERLRYARSNIIGVVLNDVDLRGGDYYRYRRYHHGYDAYYGPPADDGRGDAARA